jgi:UDP-4-amino-4,6-dideoxy-N-acetyl-beta-L-altrosamine transaminase
MEDMNAVMEVLKSDFLTQGPRVPEFERLICRLFGSQYAISANSATSALHLACMALGVGPGDRVWTSAVTFVASANCAVYCGADVDFVDINSRTFNMSTSHLEQKLEHAARSGLLPKVVIPVHLAGQSCDMSEIQRLSTKFGFKTIEDASHAVGARYKDLPVGSCSHSDITIFSFHPVKIVTTGEGGVATTNDEALAKRMSMLRSHGIVRDHELLESTPPGPWYYEQLDLGFNYRMTDLAAALGISQLARLDDFLQRRNSLAVKYAELFYGQPVELQEITPDTYSSYHLFIIRPILKELSTSHAELFERLRARGIHANLHYIPVYRHPYYSSRGYSRNEFPNAEAYYRNAMSIPMYPELTDDQQNHVVRSLLTPRGYQTLF